MSSRLTALLACFLAASAQAAPGLVPLSDKPFGILLLGEGGDQDWQEALAAITRKLGPGVPLEFAAGEADVKEMQKGVDRLQAARAKKIVVVPLMTASESEVMDEVRFILGIRPDPSPAFFRDSGAGPGYSLVHRIQTKLPVVLAAALDDHPLVVETLTARALKISRKAPEECLVLVGVEPASDPYAERYRRMLADLAQRVRARGGFKSALSASLDPSLRQSERQRSEANLYKLAREASRTCRLVVVPHAATGALASRQITRALQGVFMRYNERGLLPDERMTRWVAETAERASRLPDMRTYKDAGRALPSSTKPMRLPAKEIY